MAKTDAKKKTWAFLFLQEPIITIGVPMFYEPIVAMDSGDYPEIELFCIRFTPPQCWQLQGWGRGFSCGELHQWKAMEDKAQIQDAIKIQGEVVRKLKSEKASKEQVSI